jgi:two-component system KDP operon response regulator KdpE
MTMADKMDEMGYKDQWAISRRHERAIRSSESSGLETPGSKQTILVIEDEQPIQKFLHVSLTSNGYNVIEAVTGESGVRHAANDRPNLVILDLGLPDLDGLEVMRRIREWSAIPIIIVSARGKEQDKVVALDAGADDYLTKPFGVPELLARVRVALRRAATVDQETGDAVFESDGLRVDLAQREVTRDDHPVHLTPNEFKLLAVLVRNAGKVLTHRQLLKEVWGPDAGDETHYVRVFMNQLRQKLEIDPAQPRHLLTETGVGYRLAVS